MEKCLAPDSELGGVGCDNMTVVVVALLNGKTPEEWAAWVKKRVDEEVRLCSFVLFLSLPRVSKLAAHLLPSLHLLLSPLLVRSDTQPLNLFPTSSRPLLSTTDHLEVSPLLLLRLRPPSLEDFRESWMRLEGG